MGRRLLSPLEVDTFFETIKDPSNFEGCIGEVKDFIQLQEEKSRPLVIVTSGGTVVPLERQMVRFLDNFSAGTRGAISTEWFLRSGYAVIFLHRQFSMKPFSRKYRSKDESILDFVELQDGNISVRHDLQEQLKKDLSEYQQYKDDGALLMIPFYTISDYLYLLMKISQASEALGSKVMVYLAAAVSDFFLPENQVSEHKIQSDEGTLTMKLEPVPKLIYHIVNIWAPSSFVVSFKLETDPSLLLPKSLAALQHYSHQVVVANLLKDRKRHVQVIQRSGESKSLEVEDPCNQEIEELLVMELMELHKKWINTS